MNRYVSIRQQANKKGKTMRFLPVVSLLCALLIMTVTPAAAASPELVILAPANNGVVNGTDVAVQFEAKNFTIVKSTVPLADYGKRPDLNKPNEGHLHITLDLNPLVVWDQNEAYTFNTVATGTHQLTVELVNNDHSSLTPPLVRTLRFNTAPAGTVAPTAMPATGSSSAAIVWMAALGLCLLIGGLTVRSYRIGSASR